MKPATGPIRAALRMKAKKVAETSRPGFTRMLYFSAKTATATSSNRPDHENDQDGAAVKG
jgi:hypothetical protein